LKHRADAGPIKIVVPAPVAPQPQPVVVAAPTAPVRRAVHPVNFKAHQPQRSAVLLRQPFFATPEVEPEAKKFSVRHPLKGYTKAQLALVSMAVTVFVVGLGVSAMTLSTNHLANAKVAALAKAAVDQPATTDSTGATASVAGAHATATTTTTPPSTARPSTAVISNYAVGPTLPRYLDIPKLGVHARVLSLGILNSGALATPNNVFDVGWYNESSLPGQPGATLIDGHVSSWTSHGVFYGIKTLAAGDLIQVERGDGQVMSYKVVRSQVYDHNDVDMQSAVTPVDPTKPGLNLITCTGDVIPGTNEFNERVLVYATQA